MSDRRSRNRKNNEESVIFGAYSRVCIIVFAGAVLSLVLFLFALNQNMKNLERGFRHDFVLQTLSLHHKIEVLEQFWRDVQSFYASSQEVTESEFRSFARSALTHNILLFVGWQSFDRDIDAEKAVFAVAREQKNAASFKEHFVNHPAVSALTEQVKTSGLISVGEMSVMDQNDEVSHLVLAVPTYDRKIPKNGEFQALSGVLVLFIDKDLLFASAFQQKQDSNISVYLTGKDKTARTRIYRHDVDRQVLPKTMERFRDANSTLTIKRTIPLGAQFLEIEAIPSFAYMGRSASWEPWVALLLGIVLTAFASVWFYHQISRNIEIKKLVHEKTRALTHSERRVRSIIATAMDSIVSFDENSNIIDWNKQAEETFGWSYDEVAGKKLYDIVIAPDYREIHNVGMKRFLKTGESKILNRRVETKGIRKDGTIFPIEAAVTEQKFNSHYHFTAFIRDITEQKETEARIKEYTNNLKRSNQELDDFVYVVSHDLKEPLRGLYSYSQFLQEDYGDKLDKEGQDKLDTLKNLAIRMEELIDTLLYYSRLGRGKLAFKETDLNRVLDKTLDLLKPVAEENNARITINDKLPIIPCDRARVGEIFRNLIVNGIKYNDNKDKHVEVGVTTFHEDYPDKNVFYVADNGIGIDDKHRDAVFKMFKRLHGRDAYGGGTGSGLAFVKKIVSRHGGTIWIEPNKDKGSIFYFTLERK